MEQGVETGHGLALCERVGGHSRTRAGIDNMAPATCATSTQRINTQRIQRQPRWNSPPKRADRNRPHTVAIGRDTPVYSTTPLKPRPAARLPLNQSMRQNIDRSTMGPALTSSPRRFPPSRWTSSPFNSRSRTVRNFEDDAGNAVGGLAKCYARQPTGNPPNKLCDLSDGQSGSGVATMIESSLGRRSTGVRER